MEGTQRRTAVDPHFEYAPPGPSGRQRHFLNWVRFVKRGDVVESKGPRYPSRISVKFFSILVRTLGLSPHYLAVMTQSGCEPHDDIYSILRLCGVVLPHLDRMERISSEMRELEWKMMRRAAAGPADVSPLSPTL